MIPRDRVSLVSTLVLLGFFLSLSFHYALGSYLRFPYPYNTFLFDPSDRMMDFVWPYRIAFNPYEVARPDFQNPPFLYLIARFLHILDIYPALFVYLLAFLFLFLSFTYISIREATGVVNTTEFLVIGLLSYPVLFAIDRANFDLFVFILLFLFVRYYRTNPRLGVFSLALATATKGYPLLFISLLLADKKYRSAIYVVLLSLILTIFSYLVLPDAINQTIQNHLRNLRLYSDTYAITGDSGWHFGNSMFGALKLVYALIDSSENVHPVDPKLVNVYTIFSAVIVIGAALYTVLSNDVLWRKAAILVCSMNFAPLVSGDYRLLHLFIPLFLFFKEPERRSNDIITAMLFGLLLVPKAFYRLPSVPEVSSSVLITPLLMLSMGALIVGERGVATFKRWNNARRAKAGSW